MPEIFADILIDDARWKKARLGLKPLIQTTLEIAAKSLPVKPKAPLEVSITLCDDAAIKMLNREHRGKNKPTNVLSFPLWETFSSLPVTRHPVPIGDIVIAFDTMEREAREQDKKLKHHFSHMLTHGFLHLLGYDHMNDDEAEKMEKLETKILKKLGINDPYAV